MTCVERKFTDQETPTEEQFLPAAPVLMRRSYPEVCKASTMDGASQSVFH